MKAFSFIVFMQIAFGGATARLCYCHPQCPEMECELLPGAKCYAHKELHEEQGLVYHYGCLLPELGSDIQCQADTSNHYTPNKMECCDDEDYCNQLLEPVIPERPKTGASGMSNLQIGLVSAMSVVFLLSIGLLVFLIKRRRNPQKQAITTNIPLIAQGLPSAEETSGSGSGYPVLVPRTIARQIRLLHTVGKGRYGEVWRGSYHGESVAVKIFVTTEEASWSREKELYETTMLRHDNILGYIASDIKGTGWTEMWLITEFHEHGSLYDYLQRHPLTALQALRLMHSAACGLSHLHSDVWGTKGKPAIAHRDIKSKNILVKKGGVCCIADLGMAVKYIRERNEIDIAPNTRQGTKRYMSPEILDDTIVRRRFESYKMSDMYSFGLVLWEIARRVEFNGMVEPYQYPFEHDVPADPTFEQMRKLVCEDGHRPALNPAWKKDTTLGQIAAVIVECWHASPAARLSSLRVQKTLGKLMRSCPGHEEVDYKPLLPPSCDSSSAYTYSSAYTDVTRSSSVL